MKTIKRIKNRIGVNFINSLGWRSNKKIVVFESDDWGSIRMPSKETFKDMLREGLITEDHPYAINDSLESENDLQALIDVLSNYKDHMGNHPVFTLNTIMANPDFDKIADIDFKTYFYEDFRETYKRYPEHKNSFQIMLNGIAKGVFFPQFHGREHINVSKWLKTLQSGNERLLKAFHHKTFFTFPEENSNGNKSIAAALDFNDNEELNQTLSALRDGYNLFEKIFGFKSQSFIATNYIWHEQHEELLAKLGINFIQGTKYQNIPIEGRIGFRRKLRFTGQTNRVKQVNIVRNCFFEPSNSNAKNILNSCLWEIENAFQWGKPAIISSHRLNYIGFLNKGNQIGNLDLLNQLIELILKKFPDAIFLSTQTLGNLIKKN